MAMPPCKRDRPPTGRKGKIHDQNEKTVSSALWDEQIIEEYRLTQEAKKYQLLLQRLAGDETIKNLNLVQYNLDTRNIDLNDLDFKKGVVKTEIKQEAKK